MSRFLKSYGLIILSALLLSLSRLPLHTGLLVFVAFIPLLAYISRSKHRTKELIFGGIIFSAIQISMVFYWIGEVTPGGLIGIWLLYGLYYFVAFALLERMWHRLPGLRWLSFVSVLVTFEYLQNFSELRFPWFHIGYALGDYRILLQVLDLGGMALLAILILSLNYFIFRIKSYSWKGLGAIALILTLWLAYGVYCLKYLPLEKQDARIAVMQPSIPQDEKWVTDNYDLIIARYDSLTALAAAQDMDLIIYPEAAVPNYLMLITTVHDDLMDIIEKHDINVFTGFPHCAAAPAEHPESAYYYNAANLFGPRYQMGEIFYKNILVPVGERMLWLDTFPMLWKLQFGQANWEFGTKIPRYYCAQHDFSPSICYELAFPHFMQKANFTLPDGNKAKADYHVNITNDAWFGTSYGPWLHGIMTKFRAIESRIQVYRSANTGISMIVDPKGGVLNRTELFEISNISAPLYTCAVVPLYHKIYPYPWFFVFSTALLYVLSLFSKRRHA